MRQGHSGAKREVGTLPGTRTPERHPGRGPRPDRGGHGPRGPAERPPGTTAPPPERSTHAPSPAGPRSAPRPIPPTTTSSPRPNPPSGRRRWATPGSRTVALPVTPPTADPAQAADPGAPATPATPGAAVGPPSGGAPTTGRAPTASPGARIPSRRPAHRPHPRRPRARRCTDHGPRPDRIPGGRVPNRRPAHRPHRRRQPGPRCTGHRRDAHRIPGRWVPGRRPVGRHPRPHRRPARPPPPRTASTAPLPRPAPSSAPACAAPTAAASAGGTPRRPGPAVTAPATASGGRASDPAATTRRRRIRLVLLGLAATAVLGPVLAFAVGYVALPRPHAGRRREQPGRADLLRRRQPAHPARARAGQPHDGADRAGAGARARGRARRRGPLLLLQPRLRPDRHRARGVEPAPRRRRRRLDDHPAVRQEHPRRRRARRCGASTRRWSSRSRSPRSARKDEILGDYLNAIYFGRGAYGIQAAARPTSARTVQDLTPAEGALLAGRDPVAVALGPGAEPGPGRAALELRPRRHGRPGLAHPGRPRGAQRFPADRAAHRRRRGGVPGGRRRAHRHGGASPSSSRPRHHRAGR